MGNVNTEERCNDAALHNTSFEQRGLSQSHQSLQEHPEVFGEFEGAADALMRCMSNDLSHSFIGTTTHPPSASNVEKEAAALGPRSRSLRPTFQIETPQKHSAPKTHKVWRPVVGRRTPQDNDKDLEGSAANTAWVALWKDICNTGGTDTDDQDALLSCQRWRRTKLGEKHDVWFKIRHPAWERLTKSIRRGVPASLRSNVWYACSGAEWKKREAGLKTYDDFRSEGQQLKGTEAARVIEVDIPRTGVKGYNRQALENVLLAFVAKNAQIGYCQSMNFIAATLLLYHKEDHVFWMLCSLIEDLMPTDYYTDSMIGLRVDLKVFEFLVAQYLPGLDRHFKRHQIDLSPITMNWFLCLFVNTLPADLSHRVMDCLLHEGSKLLFRTALSVLRLREKELKEVSSVMDAYYLLRVPFGVDSAKRDPIPGAASASAATGNLLDTVYGMWLQGFSSERLRRLRKEYQVIVQAEDEAAAARRLEFRAAAAHRSIAAAAVEETAEVDGPEADGNCPVEQLKRLSVSMINPPEVSGVPFGFASHAQESSDLAKSWLATVTGSALDVEEAVSSSESESEAGPSCSTTESFRGSGVRVQEMPLDCTFCDESGS